MKYVSQAHGVEYYAGVIEGVDKYRKEMTWSSHKENISEQDLFLEATYDAKEIIKQIFIRYIRSDGNGSMFTTLNIGTLTKHYLVEIRHRKFGRCFSFHPDERMLDLGIYYFRLKL